MSRPIQVSGPLAALTLVDVLLTSDASGAVGAALITGADIKDGTVAGIDLRDDSVSGTDLRDRSVAPKDLKDNPMWAIVSIDRTVYQSNSVVEVPNGVVSGEYFVRFASPINERAVVATLYYDTGKPGDIAVRRCVLGSFTACGFLGADSNSTWAQVVTQLGDGDGNNDDPVRLARSFLIVALPRAPGTLTTPPPV